MLFPRHSAGIIEYRVESLECRCCPRMRAGHHPGASRHPSAEGNFSPRRNVPSSPPLEGYPQGRGGYCTPPPPSCKARHPPPKAVGIRVRRCSGILSPCHCEGVRSTLKTLSYDCGNPVQYVCGHSPAVLFYLLDRHALLAMTMGSK